MPLVKYCEQNNICYYSILNRCRSMGITIKEAVEMPMTKSLKHGNKIKELSPKKYILYARYIRSGLSEAEAMQRLKTDNRGRRTVVIHTINHNGVKMTLMQFYREVVGISNKYYTYQTALIRIQRGIKPEKAVLKCYRWAMNLDRTFCTNKECDKKCDRWLTDEVIAKANELSKLIAMADFKCEEEKWAIM